MKLKDAKILYPLDPGIYNKRVKFLSVNTSRGEIAEILSAINFYPCYVPLDQSLITLSVTSSNILDNIKTMLYMENQIAYANLHETKRKNDYVSYGTLVSKNIEKQIVDLYNYEAISQFFADTSFSVKLLAYKDILERVLLHLLHSF